MKEELIRFFTKYGIKSGSEYNNHPHRPYTRRQIKNGGFRYSTLLSELITKAEGCPSVKAEYKTPKPKTSYKPKVDEVKNEG